MRTVICHYHIFKNSGTSFDALLEKNYKENHISFDGPFPFLSIDQEQLEHIVRRNKNTIAFSSHQIRLPTPVSLDITFLAAIFLRHPLLRAESIYRFKQKVNDGTEISDFAQGKNFNDWLIECFKSSTQITHISNAQTRMLGGTYKNKSLKRTKKFAMEYDFNQACRNLSTAPLLARTERFDEDVERFESIIKASGLSFSFKKGIMQNVTSKNHALPTDTRVEELLSGLDSDLSGKLINANEQDLKLYELANSLLG